MRKVLSGGTAIEQQTHSKANKHDARDPVQSLGDTRTFEPPRERTCREYEESEPDDAFDGVNSGEQHGEARDRSSGRYELREQGDVENADLRVQEIREESPGEPIRARGPRRIQIETRRGAAEELDAEVDEVRGAGDAKGVVGESREGEQAPEPGGNGESPHEASEADADPGKKGPTSTFHGSGAEHQCRIEPRRDGEESRRSGEAKQRL